MARLVKGHTPILRTMCLIPSCDIAITDGVIHAFEESPELREVHLPDNYHELCLPWSQLTHLRISKSRRPIFSPDGILGRSANLVELDLGALPRSPPKKDQLVHLPKLKRLRFSYDGSHFSGWLRAPKLESLDVNNTCSPHFVDLEELSSFISCSECVLLSLSVANLGIGNHGRSLKKFVAGIPSLSRLELRGSKVDWRRLAQVIAPKDSLGGLTNIQHVVFNLGTGHKPLPLQTDAFRFLEWLAASRHRSLVSASFFKAAIRAEDEWRISRLMESGLQILRIVEF
ncbi:hypothetical protein H0H81_007305 [Sphagnurus paluster]|uniref:Uncharacterized protein n=1 Tax=Sphagnurus paluster TaxID=117069 RepID=A0A9P7FUR0_9AGAR|nr:hypothetical protein H0H81_007305 [Sphagnurus paluster]